MSEKDLDPGKPKPDKEALEKAGQNGVQQRTAEPKTDKKVEDAITQLKNDHRTVEGLFEAYQVAVRRAEKQKIAQQICQELIIHAQIEEEIFYPACAESVDDSMLDEAQVEHDSAKVLIGELLRGSPEEAYFDAKVKVLSEMIKHHVLEEEKKNDSIFAKAKLGNVNTDQIAQALAARRAELLAEAEEHSLERPRPRSFNNFMEGRMPQGQYRDRDNRGRFTTDDDDRRYTTRSSRGGSARDEDDDRRSGRTPQRDDHGRFMSDDDGRSPTRYGRGQDDDRGRSTPDRDQYGRFVSDDDDNRRSPSRSRYADDDDDRRGPSRGSARQQDDGDDRRYVMRAPSGRSDRDNDRDDRRTGGWFGDPEGHARASREAWRTSEHEGSGWYGDSEGHAEAARRGWEGRSRSSGGRQSMSDDRDDDRRSARSRYSDDDRDDDRRSSSRYRH